MRATAFALALLAGVASGAEPAFPALSGPVVDQAAILGPAAAKALDLELRAFQKEKGAQVVVVTLGTLEGRDIADYGVRLARHWGIGDAERDDGALLIVAPNERAVRIEVGRGLEGTLTDAVSHLIIQREILPRFKRGDYDGGVRAGVTAILATLRGLPYTPPAKKQVPASLIVLLIVGLVVLVVVLMIAGTSSMGGGSGRGGRSGWGRSSGWNPGSGGFSGGGGFRGGGGGFSGGGASGRW